MNPGISDPHTCHGMITWNLMIPGKNDFEVMLFDPVGFAPGFLEAIPANRLEIEQVGMSCITDY